MALDTSTQALLAKLSEHGTKPLSEMAPSEARALTAWLDDLVGPGPDLHLVSDHEIGVDGQSIAFRVLVPSEAPSSIIVYFHGGGWVLGAIDEFETLGRQLARRSDAAVVLVDYRLAPEHRYPTAVEDSWAALQWVAEHQTEIAGAAVPLIVAGDSAGGNLAAVMALRAHAAGGPVLAAQVLIYPVTDGSLDTDSYHDPANQLMLSRDSMVWFWDHYAPDPASRVEVDASPLRAVDLSGLPSALVLTAEHDPLRDEGEAYAARLHAAGVPVRHRRFNGQMHGFFTMVGLLPASAAALDYVVEGLSQVLGREVSRWGDK